MRKRQYRGPERVRSSAETAGAPSLRDVREEYATLSATVAELASAVRSSLRLGAELSDVAIVQKLTVVFRSRELSEVLRAADRFAARR